jgi:hypothetical protein
MSSGNKLSIDTLSILAISAEVERVLQLSNETITNNQGVAE